MHLKMLDFSELRCVWQSYNRDQHFRELKTVFQQSTTNHFEHKTFWRFLLHNCTLLNEIKPFKLFLRNPECVVCSVVPSFMLMCPQFQTPFFHSVEISIIASHGENYLRNVLHVSLAKFVGTGRKSMSTRNVARGRENNVCYLVRECMKAEGQRGWEVGDLWIIFIVVSIVERNKI